MIESVAALLVVFLIFFFGRLLPETRLGAYYINCMFVIAVFYIGFSLAALEYRLALYEAVIALCFLALLYLAKYKAMLFCSLALFLHGVYDFTHPYLFVNPTVPLWWPLFCAVVDVGLAMLVFYLFRIDQRKQLI